MIVLKIMLEVKNFINVDFIYGCFIVVFWIKSSIFYVDGLVSDSVIRNEGDKWLFLIDKWFNIVLILLL